MEASLGRGIWCMGGMSNISLDAIHLITSARTQSSCYFLRPLNVIIGGVVMNAYCRDHYTQGTEC